MTIAQQLEQKGIEKGKRKATLRIVRNMLKNGIDRNSIMSMTGLTENDMEQVGY